MPGSRWPLVAAVIILVAGSCAREANLPIPLEELVGPRAGTTHWHAAFGVYVCDEFRPPEPESMSVAGIHTHGDGVIHIHPFGQSGAGRNATLGAYLSDSWEVQLEDGELILDDDQRYSDGQECDGEPSTVQVAYWRDPDEAREPEVVTEDVNGLRFRGDGEAFTIAFVPEGTDIPLPPTFDSLAELGALDASPDEPGATTTTTTWVSTTSTTSSELPPPVVIPGPTGPALAPPPAETPADALQIEILIEGEGDGVAPGDEVTVHYVGLLADGTVFDATSDRGQPFSSVVGRGQLIEGWEVGMIGAKVGERRRLVIGADRAYGPQGRPPMIPPNAPLAFEIDIIEITR